MYQNANIGDIYIYISDHAPITLDLYLPDAVIKQLNLRLNEALITKPKWKSQVEKELK